MRRFMNSPTAYHELGTAVSQISGYCEVYASPSGAGSSVRSGQQRVQDLGRQAAELSAGLRPVEDRHLEIALGQALVLRHVEGAHPELERLVQCHTLLEMVLEEAADLVGLSTHGRVIALVLDRSVVQDVVDLVAAAVVVTDLGHQDLDFEGLDVDRKSTRLNSSHTVISYAVFCL